jgi:hypothetical protein
MFSKTISGGVCHGWLCRAVTHQPDSRYAQRVGDGLRPRSMLGKYRYFVNDLKAKTAPMVVFLDSGGTALVSLPESDPGLAYFQVPLDLCELQPNYYPQHTSAFEPQG